MGTPRDSEGSVVSLFQVADSNDRSSCHVFIFKLYAVIKILYDVDVVFNDVAIPWIEVFMVLHRWLCLCVHVAADWLLGPKLVNNNTCFLCL